MNLKDIIIVGVALAMDAVGVSISIFNFYSFF